MKISKKLRRHAWKKQQAIRYKKHATAHLLDLKN